VQISWNEYCTMWSAGLGWGFFRNQWAADSCFVAWSALYSIGWDFRPTSWLLKSCVDILVRECWDIWFWSVGVLEEILLENFQNIFSVIDILDIAIALRSVACVLSGSGLDHRTLFRAYSNRYQQCM
jgi:hypothetical protein